MTTGKRILCITHLCFGFIALLWIILYPFLGAVYHYKSQMIPFETVMQQENLFNSLPLDIQNSLLSKHAHLKNLSAHSSANDYFSKISLNESIWILLSILLPIFLLLRIDGANPLLVLLPIFCFLFILEEWQQDLSVSNEIPTESYVMENYIKEPLALTIQGQFEQLRAGWEKYLIAEYVKETPSQDSHLFEKQKKKGEFLFQVEQLKKAPISSLKKEKSSRFMLCLYLLWNLLFAYCLQEKIHNKTCQVT